jgi:RibD C-terminal domain
MVFSDLLEAFSDRRQDRRLPVVAEMPYRFKRYPMSNGNARTARRWNYQKHPVNIWKPFRGSSMAEQRTVNPLVESSSLSPGAKKSRCPTRVFGPPVHHPRPSIEMEGGTTFHFVDGSPAEALETARDAAGGQDLRLGGGPTMIREFVAAGLVDHMHIVVVPILLGRGVRLWDGLEGLEKNYQIEATSSPSGVTHVTFTRTRV